MFKGKRLSLAQSSLILSNASCILIIIGLPESSIYVIFSDSLRNSSPKRIDEMTSKVSLEDSYVMSISS